MQFFFPAFYDTVVYNLFSLENDDLDGKVRGFFTSNALLVGIVSTHMFPTMKSRQEKIHISDQVVSRIVPLLKWIKSHISKDHVCIPKH